jgi:U-box domain
MVVDNFYEEKIPADFFCPITHQVMQDPLLSRYGQSYERHAILTWLEGHGNACPLTRQPMAVSDLIQNRALKSKIRVWYRSRGLTSWLNEDTDDDDDKKDGLSCSNSYQQTQELPMILVTCNKDKLDQPCCLSRKGLQKQSSTISENSAASNLNHIVRSTKGRKLPLLQRIRCR